MATKSVDQINEGDILEAYLRRNLGLNFEERFVGAIQKTVKSVYERGRFDKASEVAISEMSPEFLTVADLNNGG